MATDKTRAAIMNAAEALYAERSFVNVQLRDIAARAGVALAAIGYHFGSKDGLILELYTARATAMNRERLELLEKAEIAGGGTASVEAILRTLVGPPLRWCFGKDTERCAAAQFIVRAHVESVPAIRAISVVEFNHLERFAAALRTSQQHLTEEDLCWGLHFTIAMIRQTINDNAVLRDLSRGVCRFNDLDKVIDRIVALAAPAFEQSMDLRSRTAQERSPGLAKERRRPGL